MPPEPAIEDIMLRVLARVEQEGDAGLQAACTEYPEHADSIRELIGELREVHMGGDRAGADPRRGTRLGDFTLLERIGSGGMGEVWLAEQASLDRRVALKLIRPGHLVFARSRQRFWREAQAASRLEHPNICQVYEAGEVDEVPYLAMRYVSGRSLARKLARPRRDDGVPLDWLTLIEKVARALHAAHELGLVHRDVKPGNILLDTDDEPVVVDFGLAHQTDDGLASLTATGERVGTPQYMAPEQVSGEAPVDRRTDVYALGVTLYQCLTGALPFESSTSAELYRRILSEPAPDPGRRRRGIPRELRVVIGKALEKRPENRFATAAEFADELLRIRRHEPIRTQRPGPLRRGFRWCQRNKTAAGILAVSVLGALVSLWFLRDSQLARRDLEARALLHAARQKMAHEPELAFADAVAALRLGGDHPDYLAGVQEVMFRLRDFQEVRHHENQSLRTICSPDGQYVAVVIPGEPLVLYRKGPDDALQRVPLPDVDWHPRPMYGGPRPVVFAPDGTELAMLDFNTGDRRLYRFTLGPDGVKTLSETSFGSSDDGLFTVHYPADRDDRRLLVALSEGLQVWDRDAKEPLLWQRNITNKGVSGGFLPDGRIVAGRQIFSADGEDSKSLDLTGTDGNWPGQVAVREDFMVIWFGRGLLVAYDHDGRQLQPPRRLPHRGLSDLVYDFEVDRRGERLLVVTRKGTIRLYEARTLTPLHDWWTGAVAFWAQFDPTGRRILCGSIDRIQRIFDVEGNLLDALPGPRFGVWSADGDAILASDQGLTRRWSLAPRKGVPALFGLGDPGLAGSPDGRTVVVTSNILRRLFVLDAEGRVQGRHDFDLVPDLPADLRFAPRVGYRARFGSNRELVVTTELGGTAQRWRFDGAGGASVSPMPAPRGQLAAGLIHLDGADWLFRAGRDIRRGTSFNSSRVLAAGFASVVLSADARHVLVGGNRDLRLLELTADEPREVWRAAEDVAAPRTALAPDLSYALVSPRRQQKVLLYPITGSSSAAVPLAGHPSGVQCFAISCDGRRFASGGLDGVVVVWDRETLREVMRLRHERLLKMVFTATGRLVTASGDGTVRFWCLDAGSVHAALARIR